MAEKIKTDADTKVETAPDVKSTTVVQSATRAVVSAPAKATKDDDVFVFLTNAGRFNKGAHHTRKEITDSGADASDWSKLKAIKRFVPAVAEE